MDVPRAGNHFLGMLKNMTVIWIGLLVCFYPANLSVQGTLADNAFQGIERYVGKEKNLYF